MHNPTESTSDRQEEPSFPIPLLQDFQTPEEHRRAFREEVLAWYAHYGPDFLRLDRRYVRVLGSVGFLLTVLEDVWASNGTDGQDWVEWPKQIPLYPNKSELTKSLNKLRREGTVETDAYRPSRFRIVFAVTEKVRVKGDKKRIETEGLLDG